MANQALVPHRGRRHYVNLGLSKRAALAIADTYETEEMGVLEDASRRERINAERTVLMRNLAEASNLGLQLEVILEEVERGIASLQDLIDPETTEVRTHHELDMTLPLKTRAMDTPRPNATIQHTDEREELNVRDGFHPKEPSLGNAMEKTCRPNFWIDISITPIPDSGCF